jgi:ribosomal protein S18 acetylase RimI-like enzyme
VKEFRLGALRRGDRQRLGEILGATRAFGDEEIAVALELFDEACAAGLAEPVADLPSSPASYEFVGAFTGAGDLAGYICYGPTPGTDRTYDIYWIAVDPAHQNSGSGSRLLGEAERRLQEREARMLVVETSSRADYESARRFYEKRAYRQGALIRDFYGPGDHRVIYVKRLTQDLPNRTSEQRL